MEMKCPKCGGSASQLIIDVDGNTFVECLQCGHVVSVEPSAEKPLLPPKLPPTG
jgi:uncharacterized Zn finger protein